MSLLLAFLHIGAMQFKWYWFFWWFDILTHFVGGVVVALGLLFWYIKYGSVKRSITKKEVFVISTLGVLVVGVLWELFEFLVGGSNFAESGFTADSISDLFTDIAGGAFVYVIISFIHGRKS